MNVVHSGKFYYGWVIVSISALGIFFSGPGQTYSNSIFIDHYIADFGWSRSLVSSIYSGATFIAGMLMMAVGRLVDRFGQRIMMVSVGTLLAIACFWNSIVFTPIMLFIGFFAIRLFGQGSMTLVPNTLVPQWFIKKRGRAMSLMMIGGFAGATFIPVINAWLIELTDWQTAWRVWGIALLLFFVPVAWIWVRNTPEEMGMLPDQTPSTSSTVPTLGDIAEENWTLKEAMRTRAFWLILLCVAIPALVNTGLTFHLTSILGEQGLGGAVAASVLSIMAFVGFPITFVAGFAVDRFPIHWVLAFVFVLEIIFLILILITESVVGAVIFAVVWGAANGLEQIVVNAIWPNYFGRRYLGSIRGVAMMLMVLGSSLGPLPYGVAFDWFGSYSEIVMLTIICPIIGIFAALCSPAPKKG